ncbi:MAG: Tfp pilus assembly protein PilF [Desulfovibrionaceae bacterium]|nr:Tfp pilus assembly protein PilF [Desulfovibrionaceae bacterium]MBF0513819.1 Tfp pilus assembly protein PilF [Desulfovibrionaceae bacterium]
MASPSSSPDKPSPARIKGVFSMTKDSFVGAGATRRKVSQAVHYYAEEDGGGEIAMRALNPHFVPSGPAKLVTREELLSNFLPDPTLYLHKVLPAMRRVDESVERADRHRSQGELFTAEFDYKEALSLDEEHVRATFGLGLTYLERGENDNAVIVFHRIVELDHAFDTSNKHLFNEFGIRLRKNRMYPQALRYYFRIFAKVKNDDHLLYNISRTLFEMSRHLPARHFLFKAMAIDPGLKEAAALGRAIEAELAKSDAKPRGRGRRQR